VEADDLSPSALPSFLLPRRNSVLRGGGGVAPLHADPSLWTACHHENPRPRGRGGTHSRAWRWVPEGFVPEGRRRYDQWSGPTTAAGSLPGWLRQLASRVREENPQSALSRSRVRRRAEGAPVLAHDPRRWSSMTISVIAGIPNARPTSKGRRLHSRRPGSIRRPRPAGAVACGGAAARTLAACGLVTCRTSTALGLGRPCCAGKGTRRATGNPSSTAGKYADSVRAGPFQGGACLPAEAPSASRRCAQGCCPRPDAVRPCGALHEPDQRNVDPGSSAPACGPRNSAGRRPRAVPPHSGGAV